MPDAMRTTPGPDDFIRKVCGFRPHAYQSRIVAETFAAIVANRSGIVMAPTGSGKSLLICALAEDAVSLGRPVLVLHHSMSLLLQNARSMRKCESLASLAFGLVVARNYRGARHLGETTTENGFGEAVTLGTFGSMRERFGPFFRAAVKEFASRGGIIVIDEGEKAAALVLATILQEFADAGCCGYLYSATPFRMDGRDPLEPFGTTIRESLIGVAGHNEVLATGQIVPTLFKLVHAEYVGFVTTMMMRRFVSVYSGFLSDGDAPDRAAEKAFNRFLRSKEAADVAISDKLIEGVGFMWRKYVGSRRLTMIHCAGVDHAERMAAHMAKYETVSQGLANRRFLKVAVVNGSECYLMRGSERVEMPDLGKGLTEAREIVLEHCRLGDIDVIVNVDALTSGVDIPMVDFTIFASFFRTAPSAKQCSGRGERAMVDGSKKDHLLLDLGVTIATMFRGIKLAAKGLTDPSRNAMHEVDHRIRNQLFEWMEGDATILDQVEAVERATVSLGLPVDRDDVREGKPKSEIRLEEEYLVKVCNGLWVDDSRRSKPGVDGPSAFHAKTFMLVDFQDFGLPGAFGVLPRFCGIVYDNETNEGLPFFHSDREEVVAFARHGGCVSTSRNFMNAPPTSDRQVAMANARPVDREGIPTGAIDWLPAFCRDLETFTTRRQVGIVADFKGKTAKLLLCELLDAISGRLFDVEVVRPARIVLLDSCESIEFGRWSLLTTYLHLFRSLIPLLKWKMPQVMVVKPEERDFAFERIGISDLDVVAMPSDAVALDGIRSALLENVVALWSGSKEAKDPWAFAACGVKGRKLERVFLLRERIQMVLKELPLELVEHQAGVYGKMSVTSGDVKQAVELRDEGQKLGRGRARGTTVAKALHRLGDAVTAKPTESRRTIWKTFPMDAVAPRLGADGVSNRGLGWMSALGLFGHESGRIDLLIDCGRLRKDLAEMSDSDQDKLLSVLDDWIATERYRLTPPSVRVSAEIR